MRLVQFTQEEVPPPPMAVAPASTTGIHPPIRAPPTTPGSSREPFSLLATSSTSSMGLTAATRRVQLACTCVCSSPVNCVQLMCANDSECREVQLPFPTRTDATVRPCLVIPARASPGVAPGKGLPRSTQLCLLLQSAVLTSPRCSPYFQCMQLATRRCAVQQKILQFFCSFVPKFICLCSKNWFTTDGSAVLLCGRGRAVHVPVEPL